MAFTQLLERESYCGLRFTANKIDGALAGRFNHDIETRRRVSRDVKNGGDYLEGDILAVSNAYYYLQENKDPRDIILPSNPIPGDFVAIIYDNLATVNFVSREAGWFPKFKVKQYKHKIMHLDESLQIDVPFHRIQFTFFDEMHGWLIS